MNISARNMVKLINPTGQYQTKQVTLARRLDALQGKSIGLIDNTKPNVGLFLSFIEEMIHASCAGTQTHTVRKKNASVLGANELDGKVQGVVSAWGD